MVSIGTLLDVANRRNFEVSFAPHYSEPGYEYAGDKPVVFADWNGKEGERFAKAFERAGAECEWSDEWTTCDDCGGAFRTSPDSYGWKMSGVVDDGYCICHKCIDPAEYLESLEGKSRAAVTLDIDPTEYGYVLVRDDLEHGWYGSQNADPAVVAKSLREAGVTRFVFKIDSVGQFDLSFSVYVHESDGADVVESLKRALRGV